MTGQTLLNQMELLNRELQLQAGEADVTNGLLALNIAQDYFESLAAARGKILGSSTGTLATANQTESTTFTAGLLRIDRLQRLGTNNLPAAELIPLKRAGGHAVAWYWPLNLIASFSSGFPAAYWTNGTSVYWAPLPDGIYTIRWYGFAAATDITASGTFLYPDICAFPIASFASRLIKGGVDDAAADVAGLAQESFKATLDALSNFSRDGATGFEYTEVHQS